MPNSNLTVSVGETSLRQLAIIKKCLLIFVGFKNMHYICRDKMSIHPLKLFGKGINYVGAIIFSN